MEVGEREIQELKESEGYRKRETERNRRLEKVRSEIFYCCKIISSKTGWNQNFFGIIFLWLKNHFLENSCAQKCFMKQFFGRNIFMVAKSFPPKQV